MYVKCFGHVSHVTVLSPSVLYSMHTWDWSPDTGLSGQSGQPDQTDSNCEMYSFQIVQFLCIKLEPLFIFIKQ